MTSRSTYLVFSNPVEGREDEFNRWYDEVHVPDVLSMPGLVSAQRFALADAEVNRNEAMPPPPQRYLTIYEMEGDIDAVMGRIRAAVAEGKVVMSESLDLGTVAMSFWSPTGPRIER